MKFRILNESFLLGLQFNSRDLEYGTHDLDGKEYHEILINPPLDAIKGWSKGIIDAAGNLYIDKPQRSTFDPLPSAIHKELLKAIKKQDGFKAAPKLMVYAQDNKNYWDITNDNNNDIKNATEFGTIIRKFRNHYPGAKFDPEQFKSWMTKP
jgi:hypothetical protein